MKTVYLTLYVDTMIGREVLPGIARYAREQGGWSLQAFPHLPLKDQDPDGVIGIFSEGERDRFNELLAKGVPLVCLSGFDPPKNIPLVSHDDEAVGAMAADHLIEKGYRRFAFIHDPRATTSGLRKKGFQQRLAERKMPEPQIWEAKKEQLKQALAEAEKPIGVFAINDKRARIVENACREARIHIPSKVGLLGVDNDTIECELCPVPLSSIVLQFAQSGWEAARVLDELMRGKSPPKSVLRLPPLRLEERLSTDALWVEDAIVRQALARMKATMHQWAGVEHLARELSISKRMLEIRFRKATGATIHQKLQEIRMEEASRLLREERLTVTETAERIGMMDTNRFSQVFQTHTGQTPTSFRREIRK
ncbi:MAG: XylR family transcriptional regulator [Opitutales bacterium]|nr:XylR family transcriptional regulator [Opitutales bacterium]MCH8539844.1 XylR family transcriptional regulator [Opitutales bacterium]